MRKILFVLCFGSLCATTSAQQNQQKIDSVVALVKKYFNAQDADKLYELTGDKFRQQLSKEQFATIGTNNLFPLGEMKDVVLEQNKNGLATYKASFTAMDLLLILSLDAKDQLEAFLFKPYKTLEKKTTSTPSDNKLATAIDKSVDSAMQAYLSAKPTVGASVGILKDGKMYLYNYGEAVKGSNQLPGTHTLYEIGSITKTFTSLLLADAVERKKIKLDDPVNKYLPSTIPSLQLDGVPVTIKTLANHTSGLPRMPDNFSDSTKEGDPYVDYTKENMFDFLKTVKLGAKPGTRYDYSNLGAALLGVILEKINGKSFEAMVKEKITTPLGMNETKQTLLQGDLPRFAKGYDEKGAETSHWNFKAFAPAGALRSTSSDMLKYAQAQINAPKSLKNAIELTHTVTFDNKMKLGLAWHYIKPGKDEVLFHNGGTGGFRSYLAVDEKRKLAVVVLSNSALDVDESGNSIMRSLQR